MSVEVRARPSTVVLDRVHARDAAGLEGRARGSLTGVSLALAPGVYAVLGAPEDGTLAFASAVSGTRPPMRGRVTVLGRDPSRSPLVRARIGVLAPEARLPAASSVRGAVQLALRARGERSDRADAILGPLGLSHLHGRHPRSLAFTEQRAVELALAITTPAPALLVLHEPLAEVAGARLDLVSERLREAASAGACVVITTSSPGDARALADRVIVLHKGLVGREVTGGAVLALADSATIRVWVRSGARDLAAALSARSEVSAVSWKEAPQAGEDAVLEVRGADEEACALALIDAAFVAGVEIEAMVREAPGLGEVRSATEALWKRMRAPAVHIPLAPPPPPPPPSAIAIPPAGQAPPEAAASASAPPPAEARGVEG